MKKLNSRNIIKLLLKYILSANFVPLNSLFIHLIMMNLPSRRDTKRVPWEIMKENNDWKCRTCQFLYTLSWLHQNASIPNTQLMLTSELACYFIGYLDQQVIDSLIDSFVVLNIISSTLIIVIQYVCLPCGGCLFSEVYIMMCS